MTDQAVCVVPLGADRAEEATALIARAFQGDPMFVSACPDPDQRARLLPWIFLWSVWKGYLFGETLGTLETDGKLVGVVAALKPGGGEFTPEQLAGFGYGRGREAVGAEVWDRSTAALNAFFDPIDATLHRAVPEPHWYRDVIAVEPARQGIGIGSSLLRAVGARADADGVPVVLLTCQPRNVPFYKGHGYAVVCGGTEPARGLSWWGFRREPGA
jgi:GNAT superfamily N-acetyltransferase